MAVTEHSQADGQNAVANSLWVGPSAGVEEQEDLEVGDEEDSGPHPEGQKEEMGLETLAPGGRGGQGC